VLSPPPSPPSKPPEPADNNALIHSEENVKIEQVGDWQFWRFDQLDSTSKTAKDLFARDQLKLPAIIFTRTQTAGYGRQGRDWQQGAGNLAISYVLEMEASPMEAGALAMLSSLAVLDSLTTLLQAAPTAPTASTANSATAKALAAPHLQLKWPNDVLIDGKKCAGILVEPVARAARATSSGHSSQSAVVIGIGINIASHPQDCSFAATDLATATGLTTLTTAIIAAYLTDALAMLWQQWYGAATQADQAALRQRWLSYAWGLGQPVTLLQGGSTIDGIFEAVADDGRLQLRLTDGRMQLFSSGEVSLRAPHQATPHQPTDATPTDNSHRNRGNG
jgi:BirA family biotin operon repressor/biotin-[acetyl-CoA-carboxylase] ligase